MILPGGFCHLESTFEFRDIALNTGTKITQPFKGFLLHTHIVKTQTTALVEDHVINSITTSLTHILRKLAFNYRSRLIAVDEYDLLARRFAYIWSASKNPLKTD